MLSLMHRAGDPDVSHMWLLCLRCPGEGKWCQWTGSTSSCAGKMAAAGLRWQGSDLTAGSAAWLRSCSGTKGEHRAWITPQGLASLSCQQRLVLLGG
eukprot:1158998-Pelagomonas_calceolata.AAC.3